MFTQTNAEENTAPVLMPEPCSQMPWRVSSVAVAGSLALSVTFKDGLSGSVRFEPSWLDGVFTPLQDPAFFAQATVENGAVTWPGELDLAPDAMYHAIKTTGEWILR